VELPAVLKAFNIPPDKVEDELLDNQRYWFSTIQSRKTGKNQSIVITSIGTSGNIDSATATNILIQHYHPDLLILTGICAGIEGKVDLCDVVASEEVIGYEIGRLTSAGLEQRPRAEVPPNQILQDLRFFQKENDWFDLFSKLQATLNENQLPMEQNRNKPKSCLGIIASGEKLFADGSLNEIRKAFHERIRAGEMESIGFSSVCNQFEIPWIVVKGISDFGNPLTKDGRLRDKYHFSAANAAASWIKVFIESGYSKPFLSPEIKSYKNNKIIAENTVDEIRYIIANHGLDDETWAVAISAQYFLVGLAKVLSLNENKDFFNLLNRFLSSFHYNIKGELILEKDHMLITPQETQRIVQYMAEEDKIDNYYRQSEKMMAEKIDANLMTIIYHYGLTLRISSAEKIKVLDEIRQLSLNKLLKMENSLDEYGGWYPYRIPWITARILISLKESDTPEIDSSGSMNIIIQRALDSLVRRIYHNKYWRSGVGMWVSQWESTALCLEALDRWDAIEKYDRKIKQVLDYSIEKKHEWMVDPPDFSTEEASNKTLSSVLMVCVLQRIATNNSGFNDYAVNSWDNLSYLNRCVNTIGSITNPTIRQFCTIPQILYYISDTLMIAENR
jgi:nucleoside phosphorylase